MFKGIRPFISWLIAVTPRITIIRDFILLYGVTFLLVLPYFCRNMKHSWYFTEWKNEEDAREHLEQENNARIAQSEEYLRSLHPQKLLYPPKDDSVNIPQVTIVIITQSRSRFFPKGTKPRYLTQNVAKFLQVLDRAGTKNFEISLYVCNVDPDPAFHEEALSLAAHVTLVNQFTKLTLPTVHPKEKEKQDYQFCLNHTLTYPTDFVFLIEDDALPTEDVILVLEKIIDHHFLVKDNTKTVSYIKFYHPERLREFLSGGIDGILQLFALSILGAFISRCLFRHRQSRLSMLLSFMYFMLLALSIGRVNLFGVLHTLSPYLYSTVPAPSCCTQAILYSRSGALDLVQYLKGATCGNQRAKDDIIEAWSRDRHLRAYLVQPSTFSHVGMYSALRGQIVNPFLL